MEEKEELSQEIKSVFEPFVKRQLSESEVFEIASNLAGFAKTLLKMNMEVKQNGQNL